MTTPDALAVTRRVIRVLIGLNWLMGFGILALLIVAFVDAVWLMTALGVPLADATLGAQRDMRLIMVFGLAGVPITNMMLGFLDAIVESVGAGDPFVAYNAKLLKEIARMLVFLNILDLAVGIAAAGIFSDGKAIDIGWRFSFTPWLAVLLIFVLARVFEHGTRMRADLEGTV